MAGKTGHAEVQNGMLPQRLQQQLSGDPHARMQLKKGHNRGPVVTNMLGTKRALPGPARSPQKRSAIFNGHSEVSPHTSRKRKQIFTNLLSRPKPTAAGSASATTENPLSDADSDSDKDFSIIDVASMEAEVLHRGDDPASAEIDNILANETPNPEFLSAASTDIASTLLGDPGTILEKLTSDKIDPVKRKFEHKHYPPTVKSKRLLKERVEKYLSLVPQILNGDIDASVFYTLAKNQCRRSNHETMTQDEKWEIDWSQYVGGYMGLKRQQFIALIVMSRYRKLLQSHKNRTVVYWTINGFATYVLANEIILRFIMEDMKCDQARATAIVRESVEYGTVVTDSVGLVDDLEMGELLYAESREFMKDVVPEKKQAQANEADSRNLKPPGTHDALDSILGGANESDSESD